MTSEDTLKEQERQLTFLIKRMRAEFLWTAVREKKEWPTLQQRNEQFVDMVRSLV